MRNLRVAVSWKVTLQNSILKQMRRLLTKKKHSLFASSVLPRSTREWSWGNTRRVSTETKSFHVLNAVGVVTLPLSSWGIRPWHELRMIVSRWIFEICMWFHNKPKNSPINMVNCWYTWLSAKQTHLIHKSFLNRHSGDSPTTKISLRFHSLGTLHYGANFTDDIYSIETFMQQN